MHSKAQPETRQKNKSYLIFPPTNFFKILLDFLLYPILQDFPADRANSLQRRWKEIHAQQKGVETDKPIAGFSLSNKGILLDQHELPVSVLLDFGWNVILGVGTGK